MKFSSLDKRETLKTLEFFKVFRKKPERIRCMHPNGPTKSCYIAQVFWVVSFLAVLSF